MNKVRVISNGTAHGTQVLLPDGTDIAPHSARIEVIVEPQQAVTVLVTFTNVEVDAQSGGAEAPLDPVARHNLRRL